VPRRRAAKPETGNGKRETDDLPCRLRCGDHKEFAETAYLPERVLRLAVRLWPSIRSFEKTASKECDRFSPEGKTIVAPAVGWQIPDWAQLRDFLCRHAGDKLELITEDSEVKSIVTSFGQMLPEGYGGGARA